MEKKMNFKNLDFYECPVCGKPMFNFYYDVNRKGNGWEVFDCNSSIECRRYTTLYKIEKNQRKLVKYYDSHDRVYVYEKAYKMVGDNDERK